MRPGLVAVGVAFALVGGGVLFSVLWVGNAPQVERTGSVLIDGLPTGDWRYFNIPATAKASADLSLAWSASAPIAVSWFGTYSCRSAQGWCTDLVPTDSWFGAASGRWAATTAAVGYYVLYVQNTGNASINFSAAFAEDYQPNSLTLLPIPLAVVIAGGSLLIGTGAVVLYLGLFLPTGIYSGLGGLPEELLGAEGFGPEGGTERPDEPRPPS